MVAIIALVYGIGIVISVVGVFKYRAKIKKNNLGNFDSKVENTGKPVSGGIDHIKIICK
ncbi:MAG: hypothetical protein HDR20_10835 [Lachnospiraceae bacterium]|nr:hypothetical protein [Lachnospiraceae bacterium]